MIRFEDVYNIGKITKAHGLKGEVVFNFSDDIFDRADADYIICDIDGILVPFYIEEYRFRSSNSALMKFEDLDSVDSVKRLLGCDVYFEKRLAIESGEEELSLNYFIGFTVIDEDYGEVGEIVSIDDNTENWLFIVEGKDGDEKMIPAQEEFITEINNDEKVIRMSLPIGLLDL